MGQVREVPLDRLGEIVELGAKLGRKRQTERRIADALNEALRSGRLTPRRLGIAPSGLSQWAYDFSRGALEELLNAPLDHIVVGRPDRMTVAERAKAAAAVLAIAREHFGSVSEQQAQNVIDFFLRTADDQVPATLDDLADLGCNVDI